MSKTKETTKTKEVTTVKEAKKLNKLAVRKETINDLNVPDAGRVKGGYVDTGCSRCIRRTCIIA